MGRIDAPGRRASHGSIWVDRALGLAFVGNRPKFLMFKNEDGVFISRVTML